MYYVLNDTLFYSPDDGHLYLDEDCREPVVSLTPVLNRLLQHMLMNPGLLITRDEFLEKVWDSYGKQGSSHTLNQYVGIIRKLLEQYLHIACIETVPRQGYIFSGNIIIRKVESSVVSEQVSHFAEGTTVESPEETDDNHPQSKTSVRKNIWLLLSAILLTVGVGLLITWSSFSGSKLKTYHLFKDNGCNVYGKKSLLEDKDQEKIYGEVQVMIKKYNIKCTARDSVYFFRNEFNGDSDTFETMLSYCHVDNNNNDNCMTYRNYRQ